MSSMLTEMFKDATDDSTEDDFCLDIVEERNMESNNDSVS